MPDTKVALHIGLPKTGTTHLQRILAAHAKELSRQGILYPTPSEGHFLGAQDVLDHHFRQHRDPRSLGAWKQLVDQTTKWQQTVLISHELLSLARGDRITRIRDSFPEREIRVIATVRDLGRQLPAVWQEDVKNGKSFTLDEFMQRMGRRLSSAPEATKGFWGYQHFPTILGEWERALGAGAISVIPIPQQIASPDALWKSFSHVIGADLDVQIDDESADNVSLGASETEFLRRLNASLDDDLEWPAYRRWVKHLIARGALAPLQSSAPIRLNDEQQAWAAATSREMVDAISGRGYHVHGDLEDLVSPAQPRVSGVVDEAAVSAAGVQATAKLLRRITEKPKARRGLRGRRGGSDETP